MSLPSSIEALNQASVDSWNTNAKFWDEYMGNTGNDIYTLLEMPALERLMSLQEGEYALDLATGNGLVARRLTELGARVTATDASQSMLECASKRTDSVKSNILYTLLDVTRPSDFASMIARSREHGGFDVVTMNMAIMDIPTLEPLADALPKLLKENGRFVATILHPVFMTCGAARHIEVSTNLTTGRLEHRRSINVSRYLDMQPMKGEALHGQPATQIMFERPFNKLFQPFSQAGLVLDGMEEPAYVDAENKTKLHSYENFPHIPQILAFRLRRRS